MSEAHVEWVHTLHPGCLGISSGSTVTLNQKEAFTDMIDLCDLWHSVCALPDHCLFGRGFRFVGTLIAFAFVCHMLLLHFNIFNMLYNMEFSIQLQSWVFHTTFLHAPWLHIYVWCRIFQCLTFYCHEISKLSLKQFEFPLQIMLLLSVTGLESLLYLFIYSICMGIQSADIIQTRSSCFVQNLTVTADDLVSWLGHSSC